MTITVKFFDYPLQFKIHQKKYMEIIENVLSRGAYILGQDLEKFEENLARFTGSKYAIGVSNCTDALLVSLYAAGIKSGDEVITVSHTFVASVEVIKFLGAKPVFVDIAGDHNMDIGLVEAAITPKTRAIIPVSLNGRVCGRIDELTEIAKKHNLIIIEDSAQALGARYKGKGAGTFGLSGNFSFYPAKLLGTFGDAGAIITDDEDFYKKVMMIRNHGKGAGADIETWGLNCRMDNLHAAILDCKLKLLPEWLERRRQIAGVYDDGLSGLDRIKLPHKPESGNGHHDVYQNYEIEAEDRDELVKYLKGKGIDVMLPWGGKGVHQFKALRLGENNLPRTEEMFRKAIMLPIYPEMESDQIDHVIGSITAFYH